MQIAKEYSHRHGLEVLEKKECHDEVCTLVDAPEIGMARGNARHINDVVKMRLSNAGWVRGVCVNSKFKLDINGMKNRVGLTIQTGNITGSFYDLMKFEGMHKNNLIDAVVLIVPTFSVARALGRNIANFTRVTNDLELFRHIITVPCLVLGIDEIKGDC